MTNNTKCTVYDIAVQLHFSTLDGKRACVNQQVYMYNIDYGLLIQSIISIDNELMTVVLVVQNDFLPRQFGN